MTDVTLPNGVTVNGIPEGTSWVDVAKDAIRQGAATPQDFAAYPDIYSQLGQKKNSNKPQAIHSAGGGFAGENGSNADKLSEDAQQLQQVNPIAAASMGYSAMLADNAKAIDEHPQVAAAAGALALAPVTAGLSLPAAYAADATSQLVADSAAHGIETNGVDAMPEHPFQDVILPIPGITKLISTPVVAAAKVASPVITPAAKAIGGEVAAWGEDVGINALLRRFSPRSAATIKGMVDGGALDAAAERVVDEPPVQDAGGETFNPGEYVKRVKTVEQGADRAAAEQSLYDQQFMEYATRLHSAIEGTSYAGKALESDKTGASGAGAQNALNFYRSAISQYESRAIPKDSLLEKRLDLIDSPYFEVLMRTDSAELDNLITKIDAGEEVDPAHFLDALEAYQVNQEAQINAFARRLPQHYASDLRELARQAPDVNRFLSDAARMGMVPEKVALKVAKDYQQGFVAAVNQHAGRVEGELRDEADSILQQMAKLQSEQKNNPRLKAVLTAMSHTHDTLERMADNIQYGLEKGSIKSGVTPDSIGMLRSMAATHPAAAHLEGLYQKYRQIESGFAALPVAREAMEKAPMKERLLGAAETALTIKTLGANKAVKALAPNAISGPVSRIRKAVEARRAINKVNDLAGKSQKSN